MNPSSSQRCFMRDGAQPCYKVTAVGYLSPAVLMLSCCVFRTGRLVLQCHPVVNVHNTSCIGHAVPSLLPSFLPPLSQHWKKKRQIKGKNPYPFRISRFAGSLCSCSTSRIKVLISRSLGLQRCCCGIWSMLSVLTLWRGFNQRHSVISSRGLRGFGSVLLDTTVFKSRLLWKLGQLSMLPPSVEECLTWLPVWQGLNGLLG